jgi:hypothetical protein
MHPDLADLLSLRDGPDTQGPVAQHVAACAVCRAQVERLERLRSSMRAAPDIAGEDRWPEIAALVTGPRTARPWPQPTWRLAGTVAAIMAIAVALTLFDGSTRQVAVTGASVDSNAAAAADPDKDSVATLMRESKRLEALLDSIPEESRVARAATVMTAAGLEDRIAWIDVAIGAGEASNRDAAAVAPLWQQRVDLLNSLVAVRYAQARTASL